MKTYLMFRDRVFDMEQRPCFASDVLASDAELGKIFDAMAKGNKAIRESCEQAFFTPLQSIEEIGYRQECLRDALANPDALWKMFSLITELLANPAYTTHWISSTTKLVDALDYALTLLRLCTAVLEGLRGVAEEYGPKMKSDGFRGMFQRFREEFGAEFIRSVERYIKDMRNLHDLLIHVKISSFNMSPMYSLCHKEKGGLFQRARPVGTLNIKDNDNVGRMDLEIRRDYAINESVGVFAQVARHLDTFFKMLRDELAFYLGAVNLRDKLTELGAPICFPALLPVEAFERSWTELYDMSLALTKNAAVTGNDLEAKDTRVYIVTGANQGGKSTFLRSMGQAQVMAQCGMFVGAQAFTAPLRTGIYTHYKKEEDIYMKSGKLEEELVRMDRIVARLEPGSVVLFNESFASTNEREGSEICRQITKALMENGIEVFSVSHLYAYASAFQGEERVQFLRAGRLEGGARTFKVTPGEPLETAYGEDLYHELFGN